jgi:hypothetical protein
MARTFQDDMNCGPWSNETSGAVQGSTRSRYLRQLASLAVTLAMTMKLLLWAVSISFITDVE